MLDTCVTRRVHCGQSVHGELSTSVMILKEEESVLVKVIKVGNRHDDKDAVKDAYIIRRAAVGSNQGR